jgi:predicted DNA-binding transcriptional regulator AlpA
MRHSRQKGCLFVSTQERLLTVVEVADLLRVKASWVYDHADDLGAFRLGKYVRFSLPRLMERLESTESLGSQPNDLH